MTKQKITPPKTYRSKDEIEDAFLSHLRTDKEQKPRPSSGRKKAIDEKTIERLRILFRAN